MVYLKTLISQYEIRDLLKLCMGVDIAVECSGIADG